MPLLDLVPVALLRPALAFSSRQRLPLRAGTIALAELQAPVTVRRDAFGIPHISAAGRADLFFAHGFVHAQDRLWQLETNRRAATGRLSELLGPPALDTDRLTRTLGFARLAQADWPLLGKAVQSDLLSYSAGINAYLQRGEKRPVEFALLRHEMSPWHPLDSVAIGRMLQWTLSVGWAAELVRAQIVARVGDAAASELEPETADRGPVTLPAGVDFNAFSLEGFLEAARGPYLFRDGEGSGRGSNGWTVAGARSTTGRPLLANDLHLPLTAPAIWYAAHLHGADGWHAAGAGLVGLPYIMVGHNETCAWGATLAYTDVEDLFIEKIDGDRYLFRDEWRAMTVIEERITVRGANEHVEQVRLTHHGPLIGGHVSSAAGLETDQRLALSSTALGRENSLRGIALLNETKNWNHFVSAVRRITSPPLNLLYADVTGNSGFMTAGRIPIRARGRGLIPVPGWRGEHEWTGYVPFEAMPYALNPSRGFLVCANNRIVNDGYPHFLGAVWRSSSRAARITRLLEESTTIDPETCAAWQGDLLCAPARALVDRLEHLDPPDADAALALKLLRGWDGRMTAESTGAAVYEQLLSQLATIVLEPHLGQPLLGRFLGTGEHDVLQPLNEYFGHWPHILLRLLDNQASHWLPGRLSREAVLQRGLSETTAALRRQLGREPQRWTWGRLQPLRLRHVLGRQAPLDRLFNHGPLPGAGNGDTVQPLSAATRDGSTSGASFRQVIDVGNWDQYQVVLPPGQSGNIASPHYDDMLALWRRGQLVTMAWSPEAVAAAAREVLKLEPAGSAP